MGGGGVVGVLGPVEPHPLGSSPSLPVWARSVFCVITSHRLMDLGVLRAGTRMRALVCLPWQLVMTTGVGSRFAGVGLVLGAVGSHTVPFQGRQRSLFGAGGGRLLGVQADGWGQPKKYSSSSSVPTSTSRSGWHFGKPAGSFGSGSSTTRLPVRNALE